MKPDCHESRTCPLDGQVALVTGAGRGIGRAIALRLSRAGAAVAVCARSEEQVTRVAREIAEHHRRALALRCDVLCRDAVEDMVAQVEAMSPPALACGGASVVSLCRQQGCAVQAHRESRGGDPRTGSGGIHDRYIFASDDVRQMVARSTDIVDQDRYVLRGRA